MFWLIVKYRKCTSNSIVSRVGKLHVHQVFPAVWLSDMTSRCSAVSWSFPLRCSACLHSNQKGTIGFNSVLWLECVLILWSCCCSGCSCFKTLSRYLPTSSTYLLTSCATWHTVMWHRMCSVRQETQPQLWPFWECDHRWFFNELSFLSSTLYLICITTITLQNNHSKINDTAALFIPAPPPQHPPLARLYTASFFLSFHFFPHSPLLLFFFLWWSMS